METPHASFELPGEAALARHRRVLAACDRYKAVNREAVRFATCVSSLWLEMGNWPLQAAVIGALTVGLGALTVAIAGPGFDALRGTFLWELSRPTWPLLGLIYVAAGIAHFTETDGFENFTPPNGTWGLWWTPFSPRVNVLWTGAAEIFGGAWMTFGAAAPLLGISLPAELGPVVSDGALTLFLVTLAVTPANYYALTHGANFPLDVEASPASHLVRLAFQAVLLAGTTLMDAKMNLGLL